MSEIADWLRRAIEGDKTLAEAAIAEHVGVYWTDGDAVWRAGDEGVYTEPHGLPVVSGLYGHLDASVGEHIARHDPRDTIARCDAELAILDVHHPVAFTDLRLGIVDVQVCFVCHARLDEPEGYNDAAEGDWPYPTVQALYPCETVRLLASGYQHRDGYPGEAT